MRRSHPPRLLRLALCAALAATTGLWNIAPAAAITQVKRVRCALPYVSGKANFFCSGQHKILFTAEGFTNNNATITAELLALDLQGAVLEAIPVNNGDLARLASRVDPKNLKVTSQDNQHEVFAPVPLLRVVADDGVDRATAYCSPIPYLRVFSPDGTVVPDAGGDVTRVLAAVTLTDLAGLEVKVDGVDLLAELGIGNPAICTAESPCGGSIAVNGKTVTIADLVVEAAPAVGTLASNSLSFTAQGLGCGGHLVTVQGEPLAGARPRFLSDKCHKDALADTGLSSGLGIDITSPTPGQTGVAVPTPVTGLACSGRPIAAVNINGKILDVTGQTLTPGNGVDSADTYTYVINTSLPQTDLAADLATGAEPLGTYDAGTNRLIASATDDLGNRTFTSLLFATGTTVNPGIDLATAMDGRTLDRFVGRIRERLREQLSATLPTTMTVDNAFVVGLSPAAVQQQFNKRCVDADAQFRTKATANIAAMTIPSKSVEPTCSCNTTANFTVGTVTFTGTTSCTTTFLQDLIHVTIDLPDVNIPITASGQCGSCDPFDTKTVVSGTLTAHISGLKVEFDVTEDQIRDNTTPPSTSFVSGTTTTTGSIDVDTPCFISEACNFFISLGGLLFDPTPSVNVSTDSAFTSAIGASEPDPLKVNDIGVDQETVASYNQTMSGTLSSVSITPDGLRAGLRGTFATTALDPEIEITPGALITQPPLPALPVSGGLDAFIALSSDTFNMLLASLTLAGTLKEECQPSGNTLGDLLPADCDTLTNPGGDLASAIQQGVCHGIRRHDCSSLTAATDVLIAAKRGACHGTRGTNCNQLPLSTSTFLTRSTAKAACEASPDRGLKANQTVLYCSKQEIPPRMALVGIGTTTVSTALRFRAISVGLVVDRKGDGLDEGLDTTPLCFAPGAPKVGDCILSEACLDMNFLFDQTYVDPVAGAAVCGGVPGFQSTFVETQTLSRRAGTLCSGAGAAIDDDTAVDQTASNDIVTTNMPSNAMAASPPICIKGLDLGQFVTCSTPQLLTIETDGDSSFRDWLGVTCAITAAP